MPDTLDPQRIAELGGLIGAELAPVLQSLEESISSAIGDAEGALAASEFAGVSYAAHRCRNDALMIGAAALQDALAQLEAASRRLDLDQARDAMARVREVWPRTRDELARAARGTA